MVSRTHSYAGLVLVFERSGQEVERQVAREGNRAAQMATVIIAQQAPLQAGDTLYIEEQA
jgi:hypothetical protein